MPHSWSQDPQWRASPSRLTQPTPGQQVSQECEHGGTPHAPQAQSVPQVCEPVPQDATVQDRVALGVQSEWSGTQSPHQHPVSQVR